MHYPVQPIGKPEKKYSNVGARFSLVAVQKRVVRGEIKGTPPGLAVGARLTCQPPHNVAKNARGGAAVAVAADGAAESNSAAGRKTRHRPAQNDGENGAAAFPEFFSKTVGLLADVRMAGWGC
ncbi:hypothetical protein Q1695_004409 [Nippostrongylus brasiliensis]|nr:hypothetical protein Q1695_004409 [Nippostrongylus brasiliensis]